MLDRVVVQKLVVGVQVDGHAKRLPCRSDAGDMIDVGVCEQDVLDRERLPLRVCQQARDFVTRIDQDRFTRAAARRDEPVFHEYPDRLRFYL